MSFSVNTNASALAALQNLTVTSKALETSQNRVNTGLEVASSKDNAAVFAIAQKLRGEISGLNSVKGSLDRGLSILDIAIAAGETVSDLMIEMKEKAVAAADTGLDQSSRDSLEDEFFQLRDQADTIINNAEFDGVNLVISDSNSTSVLTNDTGSETISITAHDISMDHLQFGLPIANFDSASNASSTVTLIENGIDDINTALSDFGATAKRLELQQEFTSKLSDSIEEGIGNLVDADMAKESAVLQSLQTKQQLGLQALSIANQAPQATLSLFR